MSVLSAVAFLNGSSEQLDQRAPSPTSPASAKPTTDAAIKELHRIRTGGGNGVASLLSKFGNEATPARPPPSPRNNTIPTEVPTSRPGNNKTPTTTTTTTTRPTINEPKPSPTPPTTKKTATAMNRSSTQMIEEEIMSIYEEAVKKAEAAEKEIEDLKNQIATYETDATKVRDYEIRVEYLAQKLEQVSEDRDCLEQELRMYRERQGNLDTPVSPVFQHRLSEIFSDKQPIDNQEDEDGNSEFMHGILDAYEDDEDENSSFGIQSERQSQDSDKERQIAFLTEQLRAADEGTKLTVQHYLSELEQERLRSKAMEKVLKKQEELISTLETKLASSAPSTPVRVAPRPPRNASLASPTRENSNQTERALRAQVESQRAELEDKRTLLTQLLNEREDMLKKVKLGASRPGASSFDILAELARPSADPKSSPVDGRNTPPPTAPPRDPLPPVPSATSPSKSSIHGSLSSFHEESAVSSVTSWSSSTDFNGRQQTKKEEPQPNNFEAFYSHYMEDDSFEVDDPYEHHLEALRRLEGPESPGQKMTAH
ncbi:hypothetical protein BJV82DRAFT_667157 [Fennellomyces sp. T-0311]|nr:hypothetical protein BJV82DRAFT_667157 [Fennellomyces sp. T-0311]